MSLKIMRRPIIQLIFGVVGYSNLFLTSIPQALTSPLSLRPPPSPFPNYGLRRCQPPPNATLPKKKRKKRRRSIIGQSGLAKSTWDLRRRLSTSTLEDVILFTLTPNHLIWKSREGGNIVLIGRNFLHHQDYHLEMARHGMFIPSLKLKWGNVWDEMRSNKKGAFIWLLWYKAIVMNSWRVRFNTDIDDK